MNGREIEKEKDEKRDAEKDRTSRGRETEKINLTVENVLRHKKKALLYISMQLALKKCAMRIKFQRCEPERTPGLPAQRTVSVMEEKKKKTTHFDGQGLYSKHITVWF
ncbi:hypothetical protein ElyMa_005792800 [Elysia marginata]|uniref:Uncharacterized protein n=1 Tax=Elysia marginata TaxID=1093978 RepID=A0AAV4FSW9_9GAST|nr:hypothetical protein ElyMa_005792800 [Elysia marginata]